MAKTKAKAKAKLKKDVLNKKEKKPAISRSFFFLLLRIAMGWVFLYAGLSKVLDPSWTAAGFLTNAKMFAPFYEWFASPANIDWVNYLNMWGLTLIGVSLLTGTFTRMGSLFGAILMLAYYFPSLDFPYADGHFFLVDNHIVYLLIFLMFIRFNVGMSWGLDMLIFKKKK